MSHIQAQYECDSPEHFSKRQVAKSCFQAPQVVICRCDYLEIACANWQGKIGISLVSNRLTALFEGAKC